MKKLAKLVTLVMILCMSFSTVAFAAEPTMSVTEVSDVQEYFQSKATGSTFGYIDGTRVDLIDSATIGSPIP